MLMIRSYSAPDIRTRNCNLVFRLARLEGELLRADISSRTGMTPPTVMKIVQSFIDRNILKTGGEVDTSLGRKPTRLVFNPEAAFAVGILFEGGEIHGGLVNLAGDIARHKKVTIENTFNQNTVETIISLTNELVQDVDAPVLGIGLGLPGVVDSVNRIIEFAPLIGLSMPLDCTDIYEEIRKRTGLTVYMDNDVNTAALGEFTVRKLGGEDDLLYIAVGTGVGAGIILHGQLRRGARNLAGELGYSVSHTGYRVDRTRPGWLESRIGQKSLRKQFDWEGYGSSEAPQELIDFLTDNLAPSAANLATQLDIRTIVIGGMAVDRLGEKVLKPLRDKIDMLSLEPGVISAPACMDSGVTGAAILAIENELDEWLCAKLY